MNRTLFAMLAGLILAATCIADDLTVTPAIIATGADSAEVTGAEAVLIGGTPKLAAAVVVSVETKAPEISVQAFYGGNFGDAATVKKLPNGSFLITGKPGKITIVCDPDPGPWIVRQAVIGESPEPIDDETEPIDDGENGDGFKVLIVYEETDDLPPEQSAILNAAKIRDYLNKHCETDPNTNQPAWRVFDKDVDTNSLSDYWKEPLQRDDRDSLPWIYVTNGKRGASQPLPSTIEATLELFEKYRPKGR